MGWNFSSACTSLLFISSKLVILGSDLSGHELSFVRDYEQTGNVFL